MSRCNPSREGEMMYCSNCGKKLNKDDFFCANCGTPVLRQGLFDDNNDQSKDSFDETRLFSSEELGKILQEDEKKTAEKKQPRVTAPKVTPPPREIVEEKVNPLSAVEEAAEEVGVSSQSEAPSATEEARAAQSAVLSFGSRFKAKLNDKKLEKAQAKQRKQEEKAQQAEMERLQQEAAESAQQEAEALSYADASDEVAVESYDEVLYDDNEEAVKPVKPLSAKAIVLPVVVFGIIIGLVIGLIVTQPWAGDETDTNTGVIVTTVEEVE